MFKATNRKFVRSVAKALAFLFAFPYLMIVGTCGAVYAQLEGSQSIMVLDFSNKANTGGSMMARWATDAVWVEMMGDRANNRFNLTTRQQVEKGMAELDLTPPLDLTAVLRLADRLQVDGVVVGEVREVDITDKKGQPRQARVEIAVRMLDADTGETMNGAIARGASAPREQFTGDDDVLINEALKNAAYVAVRKMVDYIIPEATVLNAIGDNEVLLNKGAQDGFRPGMELIVSRNKDVIGKIRVKDVSNNDSQAIVVSATKGVKPEDKARAIFSLPTAASGSYGDPASKVSGGLIGSGNKKKGGAAGILPIILGLGLLLALAGGGKTKGGETAGASIAESFVPPTWTTPSGGDVPGIRIALDTGRFGGNQNIYQTQIFSSDDPVVPKLVAPPGTTGLIDYPGTRTISYYTKSDPDPQTAPELTEATVQGIDPGVTRTYSARIVYRSISSLVGDDAPVYSYTIGPTQVIGTATAIRKILASDMSTGQSVVDPNNASFEWKSVRGADEYIVEVSTDALFRTVPYRSAAIKWPRDSEGERIALENVNLSTYFPNVAPNTRIFWRVGAVNTSDNPGPIKDAYTGLRYIYGSAASFTFREEPPTPPSGS